MRLVMDAQTEARNLGAQSLVTEHLLLAATLQGSDLQASLERGGLTTAAVRGYLQQGSTGGMRLDKLFAAKARDELLPFAGETEKVMRAAVETSATSDLVTAKDLVISVLTCDEACGASKMLEQLDLVNTDVAKSVQLGEPELVGAGSKGSRKNTTLTQCSIDLTQQAREGKLDPVIGRSDEVSRCLQILVRRRKSNPVLLGDPGVGKTAIAEALAEAIVNERVPPRLIGKRLVSLELGLLVADTKYRGEFEQRLKDVVDEVTASNDTVLFIDEIHTLVGAGAADGAMDAANLLKPALARGTLQCIGATTLSEYRRYIEKDAALERRFQAVNVPEPSQEQTFDILKGLQERYEDHHGVEYSEEALHAAAKLSERYISDRFLPDKAIDLLDEAGAIRQIGLAADTSSSSLVTEADVASVVAQWTGIPVSKLTVDERKAMVGLEEQLHGRLIGQQGAVSAISRALRRARVGLREPRRPVASLFFSGPTGVGKTELAKAVAEAYYGSEKAMTRFDMSEYMEAHSVSRLTGPPPGYVGYEAGGQLTEAVRRTPHTLILMDEVEKAHPDVFNILLQVLEDGRLTDNKGRTVDFTNAMLILTSNIGSRTILKLADTAPAATADSSAYTTMRRAVKRELADRFRPEFLNRLDEIIVFSALARDEVMEVARLMVAQLQRRCEDMEVKLELTSRLRELLVAEGFSPKFGARPLRRAVQRLCEDAIAEAVLDGFVQPGEALTLDADSSGRVLVRSARGEVRAHDQGEGQGIEESSDEATNPAVAADILGAGEPMPMPQIRL